MWTPDVKANQLADVISGVAPIRSLVNVGTGVADLLLLPIAQYKKDKRIVRGVQKGTAAFMRTTAMETIKLGARLATGTQVILEHAEHVLGAASQDGQPFGATITTEAIPSPILSSKHPLDGNDGDLLLDEPSDDTEDRDPMISRYATQPEDVREGIQAAYKSLSKNLNAAAQTILAVPMEVYEQSGSGVSILMIFFSVRLTNHFK
jgi:autophagy-related protein 2